MFQLLILILVSSATTSEKLKRTNALKKIFENIWLFNTRY